MPWDCFACLKPESTDIKQLNYEHCTLNDVPAEVFVFERTLEELHLDSNRIRDLPRPLFHCHGLKVLTLSDNEVHSLPPAIASLINLHHLDVSRNALNSIPDNLKGCKHLTYVDVSVNPLEKLPEGFTQLISLEELYLNDTYLDFLPANFGRLMRLRILELRENNLNTLPKSIARLAHLQRLDIGQNDFSDVPEVIGNLPNLSELWVDSNRIRCIPPLIGNLKKLVHLEASNNNIRSVATEIEHCAKLLDLSLTCNELASLPNSLGNLRELITLKADDNQLSTLPSSIGKLANLEELILSQNDLVSLPVCIGLLRKLHILNVDDNVLEELPPEIGSCTSLTILSAHSNKLQHVPAELGHLSNLRVINLSENQLYNLPVSILNLVNLTALWLSNNQSTPLTTLQQEIDKQTGQMVCTNFMLPQSTQETHPAEGLRMRQEMHAGQPTKVKPRISFATDTDAETPSRLMRAPTPYPKELRAMAKHARAMQHLKRSLKENEDDSTAVEEMVSQEPKDVLIKEAKVKKPGIDPVRIQASAHYQMEKNLEVLSEAIDCKVYMESNTILQEYDDMTCDGSIGEMPSVIALDTGPVVREAKCVRKMNTPITSPFALTESRQRESIVSNSEQTFQHPPPYHIAAAYSKQAMYFLQGPVQKPVSKMTNYCTEQSTCSILGKEQDEEIGREQIAYVNQSKYEEINRNAAVPQTPVKSEVLTVSTEEDKNVDSFNSNTNENSSVCHSQEENVSNEVTFLSLPSLNLDSRPVLKNDLDMKRNLNFEETGENSASSHECEVNESLKDDYHRKEKYPSETFENGTENVIIPDKDDFEQSGKNGQDIPFSQKPQTFTQDKPVVSQGVIAPTPQRPRSASFGTSNAPSPDANISQSHITDSCHKVSSNPRIFNRVPLHIAFPFMHSENKQSEEDMMSLPNISQTAEKDKTRELCVLFPNSKIPVPCVISPESPVPGYHSPKKENLCPKVNKVLSNTVLDPGSISPLDVARMEQDYCNVPHRMSQTDCNMHSPYNPLHELNLRPHDMRNTLYGDVPEFIELNMELPDNQSVGQDCDQSFTRTELPSSPQLCASAMNVSLLSDVSNSGEPPYKHSSKWMFGLHKNATVFPVTIQKCSGLGFSISGGMKAISNGERYENEIFITKVHPNGPASKVIIPGDKILEVDGIDFTKLDHDEAVNVLKQTGNIVNMMISRQQ